MRPEAFLYNSQSTPIIIVEQKLIGVVTSRDGSTCGEARLEKINHLADQKNLSKRFKTANKQHKRPPRGGRFVSLREYRVANHLMKTRRNSRSEARCV